MELKTGPQAIKSITDRTVTGIFAVHGNVDSYGDRSWPGSFSKTLSERGTRVKFLWSHRSDEPPVAVVDKIREVGRDELPQKVLDLAPEATGGAEVTRTYLDTPRGNEILTGLKAGAIDEMSYAYDAIKADPGTALVAGQTVSVRDLRELKLYECSDVIYGANEATLAAKALWPTDVLLTQLDRFLAELKAGARHSAADQKMLNQVHDLCAKLGADTCMGVIDPTADAGKSRAATALTRAQRLRLLDVELELRGR